jgi:hypothetical protein
VLVVDSGTVLDEVVVDSCRVVLVVVLESVVSGVGTELAAVVSGPATVVSVVGADADLAFASSSPSSAAGPLRPRLFHVFGECEFDSLLCK